MKIALTGSSSTGKSTLAATLLANDEFKRFANRLLHVDGRRMLASMGCQSMDKMSREQLKQYQLAYYAKKKEIEAFQSDYITDRSYVDIAAYWIIRDSYDMPEAERDILLHSCRTEAKKYDLTVHLPFGLLEFEPDGYRPEDTALNKEIDHQIKILLTDWNIVHLTINTTSLSERVEIVLSALKGIK